MKRLVFMMLLCASIASFAEVKVKIYQPIRFKNVNTKAYGDLVVGQGSIEVYTDNIEEDYKKKVKFKFPEKGLMTNKKRWIKVEKYKMAEKDMEFEILRENRVVNFYAFVKRRNININEKDGTLVEGEYVGYVPIIVEQYGQPVNTVPTPLPSFPDEDGPALLPSFPDEEDRPTLLPSIPDREDRPVTLPEVRKKGNKRRGERM